MSNSFFRFKQFTIHHERCAMKVTTDACLFGAWAAEKISNTSHGKQNGIDIGAGTGLLSLMLLQKNPRLTITAVEIDGQAAVQAAENAAASPWHNNIQLITGDVKAQQNVLAEKYDVVISNPPFYENELHSPDPQKNTAHHTGGLSFGELFSIIEKVISDTGHFYLLLPFKREKEITGLLPESDLGVRHITYVRHSSAHPYNRIFLEGAKGLSAGYTAEELIIHETKNEYSAVFKHLLKDYYLHL